MNKKEKSIKSMKGGYELIMKILWNIILVFFLFYIAWGLLSSLIFNDSSVNFQSFKMWYWFEQREGEGERLYTHGESKKICKNHLDKYDINFSQRPG